MNPSFLIIIVAFGFLWFVLIRPQKRRQMEAARLMNTLNVGDEVLTAGGIYGEVTELEDDAVMVRIAPCSRSKWPARQLVPSSRGRTPWSPASLRLTQMCRRPPKTTANLPPGT